MIRAQPQSPEPQQLPASSGGNSNDLRLTGDTQSCLPNELLVQIFNYFDFDGSADADGRCYCALNHNAYNLSRSELSNISKVCKRFRELAEPLLYKVFHQGPYLDSTYLFLRSIVQRPCRAQHVQDLSLVSCPNSRLSTGPLYDDVLSGPPGNSEGNTWLAGFHDALDMALAVLIIYDAPNITRLCLARHIGLHSPLRTLSRSSFSTINDPHHFANLKHVHMKSNAYNYSFASNRAQLLLLPSLETLQISSPRFHGIPSTMNGNPYTSQLRSPSIRSVRITADSTNATPGELAEFFAGYPNLRTLQCCIPRWRQFTTWPDVMSALFNQHNSLEKLSFTRRYRAGPQSPMNRFRGLLGVEGGLIGSLQPFSVLRRVDLPQCAIWGNLLTPGQYRLTTLPPTLEVLALYGCDWAFSSLVGTLAPYARDHCHSLRTVETDNWFGDMRDPSASGKQQMLTLIKTNFRLARLSWAVGSLLMTGIIRDHRLVAELRATAGSDFDLVEAYLTDDASVLLDRKVSELEPLLERLSIRDG